MSDRLTVGELAEIERLVDRAPLLAERFKIPRLLIDIDNAESRFWCKSLDADWFEAQLIERTAQLRAVQAQVEAAKELHQPEPTRWLNGGNITTSSNIGLRLVSKCSCGVNYPCKTARALGAGEGNE